MRLNVISQKQVPTALSFTQLTLTHKISPSPSTSPLHFRTTTAERSTTPPRTRANTHHEPREWKSAPPSPSNLAKSGFVALRVQMTHLPAREMVDGEAEDEFKGVWNVGMESKSWTRRGTWGRLVALHSRRRRGTGHGALSLEHKGEVYVSHLVSGRASHGFTMLWVLAALGNRRLRTCMALAGAVGWFWLWWENAIAGCRMNPLNLLVQRVHSHHGGVGRMWGLKIWGLISDIMTSQASSSFEARLVPRVYASSVDRCESILRAAKLTRSTIYHVLIWSILWCYKTSLAQSPDSGRAEKCTVLFFVRTWEYSNNLIYGQVDTMSMHVIIMKASWYRYTIPCLIYQACFHYMEELTLSLRFGESVLGTHLELIIVPSTRILTPKHDMRKMNNGRGSFTSRLRTSLLLL